MTTPINDKQMLTGLMRMSDDEAWPHLPAWWRRQCIERMLDTSDSAAWEKICDQYDAGLALFRAIENYVTSNRGTHDGRYTRFDPVKGSPGQQAGAKPRAKTGPKPKSRTVSSGAG